ncbi:50S ribosomal protein L4 [Nitrosomonas sp.]|uniref:50S ribosomal protein L4 n=1 Tax=Nitrosomonas sp. TaxID=42353 RepID=UPI001DC712EF|nr:50S ribosomal protein L4 [Nitrosomonas sp.]MBX3616450.1 50S ribosomal protein L4 [Nitrosomonas sp.]
MELELIGNEKQGKVTVSDQIFDRKYNETLVHQVITAYLSNARMASRAQKGRSDVAKSTRKPWRQKGTGRARAGMASSPIWRGGGKIFPNSPNENYKKKLNKKMYRAGMSVILSQLIRDSRLVVADRINVESPRTKEFIKKIASLGVKEVMVITHEIDENLYLSSRNVPQVSVVEVQNADPVSLLKFKKILITADGLRKFEELLA